MRDTELKELLPSLPKYRLVFVTPYDMNDQGGVGNHIFAIYNALQELGQSVKIFGPYSGELNLDGLVNENDVVQTGSNIVPIPNGGATSRVNPLSPSWPSVIYQLRTNFDVVHWHDPGAPGIGPWSVAFSGRKRTANVATFHTSGEDSRRRSTYSKLLGGFGLKKLGARNLHARLAVSGIAAEYARSHFPGDYDILPNPVDTVRFHPEGKHIEKYKGKQIFDPDKVNLLFVGRQDPRKGFKYMAQAFANLQQDPMYRDRVRLIVVGPGKIDKESKSLLGNVATDSIAIVGEVPASDLPGFYRTANICAFPASGQESQGIVLLEAMASGIPVIHSNIDGYVTVADGDPSVSYADAQAHFTKMGSELLRGKGSVLFNPEDSYHLTVAFKLLIDNPRLREELATKGRKNAEQNFSVASVAEKLDRRYYDELLKLPHSNFARGNPQLYDNP